MRKVYIKTTVKLIIAVEEGVDIGQLMGELCPYFDHDDCEISSDDFDIQECYLDSWEIEDSK